MIQAIIARLKREPVAVRAFVGATLTLLVALGVIDSGASAEVEAGALALFNLLLLKGARDRVTPVGSAAATIRFHADAKALADQLRAVRGVGRL